MMIVMLVAGLVNGLLLSATALLLGQKPNFLGLLGGALLWGLLAALSLYGLRFPENGMVRLCCIVVTALLTFGVHRTAARCILVFTALHLAVTGMTNTDRLPILLLCCLGISAVGMLGQRRQNLIPVELSYGGKTLTLIALRDTGNTLRDPVTGCQVLIVGADIAGKLTGLTPADLQDPVNTMGAIPGLRLIPYRTIGNTGFLLALKIPEAKIGNRQGSTIVAFSPLILGSTYQALTGGTV